MPPSEWYCEPVFDLRFVPGQYQRLYLSATPQRFPVYIFADQEQLEREIATLAHADAVVAHSDLASCSPYLRFAVAFSLKHGDDLNRWGRELVQALILEEWTAANSDDPMSLKMAERMSYLVRVHDPAAIAIGAKGVAPAKTRNSAVFEGGGTLFELSVALGLTPLPFCRSRFFRHMSPAVTGSGSSAPGSNRKDGT